MHWFCVTNDDNWAIIRKKNIWGVPKMRKSIIERAVPGDLLVMYVAPKRIGGIFKVKSKPYRSRKRVFKEISGKTFPFRVDLEPVRILMEPIEATEIMKELSFVTDKIRWSAPLRRGMFQISEEDYDKIANYCARAEGKSERESFS